LRVLRSIVGSRFQLRLGVCNSTGVFTDRPFSNLTLAFDHNVRFFGFSVGLCLALAAVVA
jgi:hypothetical protein